MYWWYQVETAVAQGTYSKLITTISKALIYAFRALAGNDFLT